MPSQPLAAARRRPLTRASLVRSFARSPGTVRDLALEVLSISRRGLERRGRKEEKFLDQLDAIAKSGECQADALIKVGTLPTRPRVGKKVSLSRTKSRTQSPSHSLARSHPFRAYPGLPGRMGRARGRRQPLHPQVQLLGGGGGWDGLKLPVCVRTYPGLSFCCCSTTTVVR